MSKAYLLLGADIGDKKATFVKARQLIEERLGYIVRESSLYESEAWGFESDTTFLNQVVELELSLQPFELLKGIQDIEKELGRIRSGSSYESRTIDIDILFYDDMVVDDSPSLIIPHPHLHKRMFTLAPLSELIPDFYHPVLAKTISSLREECADNVPVKKLG